MNTGTQIVVIAGTLFLVGLGIYFVTREEKNGNNTLVDDPNKVDPTPPKDESVSINIPQEIIDLVGGIGEWDKLTPNEQNAILQMEQAKSNLINPQGEIIPCAEASAMLGISTKEIRRRAQEEGQDWIGDLNVLTRQKVIDCLNISAQIQ